MKERIIELITLAEGILDELKDASSNNNEIVSKMKSESDEEELISLALKHFTTVQYIELLNRDLGIIMTRISEAHSNAILMKVELNLSEEEKKIIDSYILNTDSIFIITDGVIIPKQKDLFNNMLEKASKMRNADFLPNYINNLINK